MLGLAPPRPARRASLTPMIDVVFLLLVFFMLAARFGIDGGRPLALAGGSAVPDGALRIVDVLPAGVRLNGVPMALADARRDLVRLTGAPDDVIVLRPAPDASLQRLVDVMVALEGDGFTALALVE